jgi:hypothetical protein
MEGPRIAVSGNGEKSRPNAGFKTRKGGIQMLKRTETFKQHSDWKLRFRSFLAALCVISFLITPIFLTGCKSGSGVETLVHPAGEGRLVHPVMLQSV